MLSFTGAAKAAAKSSSSSYILIIYVAVFGGLYFFYLRPRSKKQKAARLQTTKVDMGERAQTIGGFVGTVVTPDRRARHAAHRQRGRVGLHPLGDRPPIRPGRGARDQATTNTTRRRPPVMAQQVGSRRSMIVSLVLTIAIAFGSLAATLSLGLGTEAWTRPRGWALGRLQAGGARHEGGHATRSSRSSPTASTASASRARTVNLQGKDVVVSVPGVKDARTVLADGRPDRAAALSAGALPSGRGRRRPSPTTGRCRPAARPTR